ncbi:MAG: hypothetical protein NC548_24605 [Lachnospiraceae bacterium]|nr:hypothetical protein [Lachnospiraceae bacterium]
METDLEFMMAKMKELQMHAEKLMDIHLRLSRYGDLLNDAWIADETEGIKDVLETMERRVKWLSEELYGIGHDIVRACEES